MLQSTNHRLLLRPETPGHNLSPSALSLSNLPTLFPSFPSFSYLGKSKKNLFFAFFILFFFFIICNWYRDLGDPKGEKSRKTPKSWVYSFPESRRELLLVVPAELGSAYPGVGGPGLSRGAVPGEGGGQLSWGSRRGGGQGGQTLFSPALPRAGSVNSPPPQGCCQPAVALGRGGERG